MMLKKLISSKIFIKKWVVIILLFQSFAICSQSINDINSRLKSIKDANFKGTIPSKDAIRIVSQCYKDSRKINYEDGIRNSGNFLAILYSNKRDYSNSIKISNEIKDLMRKSEDYRNVVEYYKSRGVNFIYLGLYNDANEEYKLALKMTDKILDEDTKHYMKSAVFLDFGTLNSQSIYYDEDSILHYMKKALKEGEKISKNGKIAITGERNDWIINLNYILGDFYINSEPPNINIARNYFENAKFIYENSKTKMLLGNEIFFLTYLSKFYYYNKNYDESIKYGFKSLELQKKENSPPYKKMAYEYMAKSYAAIGDQKNYHKFMDEYIAVSDSIRVAEKRKISTTVEKIIETKDQDNTKKKNAIVVISSVSGLTLFLVFLLIWKQKSKKIHNSYLAIIDRIKNEPNNKTTVNNSNIKINSFILPEETHQKISVKIEKFEKSLGFLKKDITLSYLSNQFKTNPKSLSSVIKSNTDKNFNTYINDLRINYITQKLYNDRVYREFKIDYLAEECGYSSSKVFVTAFKKATGVTPSYYITNLKRDINVNT